MKWTTVITTTLFVVLATLAFILSYSTLQITASNNGKSGWLSYGWPFLIDGGLIIFSIAILHRKQNKQKARLQWCLVILFTVATILFNVFQEAYWLTEIAVLASAPIVLFLSFETLMGMVGNAMERQVSEHSVVELSKQVEQLSKQKGKLSRQVSKLDEQVSDREQKVSEQKEQLSDTLSDRQQQIVQMISDGVGNKAEIARQLDVARSTVYGDFRQLKTMGVIKENGHGPEVIGV